MRRLALLAALLAAIPASAAPGKKIRAELGKDFVLRMGQIAELKGTDASIRITGFINSPCPKGAYCVWHGLTVKLELTVSGSTVPYEGERAPYVAEVVDSDYKTRATLWVTKPSPSP